MPKIIRKNLLICILIIVVVDAAIGYFLFKSRSFSHLAIWNIKESDKKDYFYWKPESAPEYFNFESTDDNRLAIFRDEIMPFIQYEKSDFKIILKVVKHVMNVSSSNVQPKLALKWDSPYGMLTQVKDGASANCFHRAILFSTYLSAIGIKSRLWALENERFEAIAHTVNEVYVESLKKWVFMDTMFGFYAVESDKPLSFLESRERLLDLGNSGILMQEMQNENKKSEPPSNYKRLVRCIFLRSGNDFVDKYNLRYGGLNVYKGRIDRLPDNIRRGLDYLLGGRDVFIHYVDKYSGTLTPWIIIAKLCFYFFIFFPVLIAVILVMNLSRKETRHK